MSLGFVRSVALLGVCALAALVGGGGPDRTPARLVPVGSGVELPRRAVLLGWLSGGRTPLNAHGELAVDVVLKPRARVTAQGFLTPAEVTARFGAAPRTVALVEQSLRRRGLRILGPRANGLVIRAAGAPAAVERAFGTDLMTYRLADGHVGFANRSAPELPAAVAAHVASVVGLSSLGTFHPAGLVPAARATAGGPQPTADCAQQIATAAKIYPGSVLYTTSDIARAYGFDDLYAGGDLGAGTTIALIEFAPFVAGDIAAAQACFGTSAVVNEVPVDGGAGAVVTTGAGVNGEIESELDIETALGLAPAATIDVYEAPGSGSTTVLDAFAAAIANPAVDVISVSYGICETLLDPGLESAEASLFRRAAVEGKTIVSAAGDSGSEDCYSQTHGSARTALAVDNPASQPLVTGVGGTTLQSPGPPASESVWNNDIGSGGGGVSAVETMPGYQAGAPRALGVAGASTACGTAKSCREVPDVSANAGAPLAVFCTLGGQDGCSAAGWTGIYGTSAAAPIWGALFALAVASPACGGKPIGLANPALYTLAVTAGAFGDVTKGNNDLGFHNGLYAAKSGYDLATGLGTPIAGSGSGSDGGLVSRVCATARALSSPAAARISPSAGPLEGGTNVTITGTNLAGVASVRFGKAAATFAVVSNAKVTAVAPRGAGSAAVKLATAAGTSGRATTFHYVAAPTVRAVSPASGRRAGGARVTIVGTGLTDAASVHFGTRAARSFRVVSSTRLVAIAPAGTGTVAVSLTTPGGTSHATSRSRFRYTA